MITETKIVKVAMGYTKVKKTQRPNAQCLKCGKKIFSWLTSLAYEGVTCKECGGRGEW